MVIPICGICVHCLAGSYQDYSQGGHLLLCLKQDNSFSSACVNVKVSKIGHTHLLIGIARLAFPVSMTVWVIKPCPFTIWSEVKMLGFIV